MGSSAAHHSSATNAARWCAVGTTNPSMKQERSGVVKTLPLPKTQTCLGHTAHASGSASQPIGDAIVSLQRARAFLIRAGGTQDSRAAQRSGLGTGGRTVAGSMQHSLAHTATGAAACSGVALQPQAPASEWGISARTQAVHPAARDGASTFAQEEAFWQRFGAKLNTMQRRHQRTVQHGARSSGCELNSERDTRLSTCTVVAVQS